MSTNISKASGNKFQLIFPLLPKLDEINQGKKFSLNIVDGILPSFNLNVWDVPFRGGNVKYEGGFGEFGDWNTTFLIDSSFDSWITIADWMFSIANNKAIHGVIDQSYMIDAELAILDNFDNDILNIKFENIWPSDLSQVKYSYQDNGAVLTCDVKFSYDRFFKSEK